MKSLLNWKIELEDGRVFTGSGQKEGRVVTARAELPEGVIRSVSAKIHMPATPYERIFMNGYQSWTYSPEYRRSDRMRGLKHLPAPGVKHFALDRYGDYHFMDYPGKPGMLHGYSWCYFRDDDRFRLIASLDETAGYTVFRYNADKELLTVSRDCEGLACGGTFRAFDLYFAEGAEDDVFDGWFAAMGIRPRTTEKLRGYCSWYNRYQDISEESILDDLAGCGGRLEAGDLFQIDDGWEPFVGDWLKPDRAKFPNGMKAAADAIHAKGYKAGLWLAPFAAETKSEVYRKHPEWFLWRGGDRWCLGSNWSSFYALDMDNPEVLNYLREVFHRVFDEWGFDLVKLDFLYGAAPFGSAKETRAGRMIRAMQLLRELCGDHLILGCGVPLMPAFGLADYCRIGCDVGLDWDDSLLMQQIHRERVSTKQSISNTIYRRQLNGRAFGNDPDVFFLRDSNLKLTPPQKEMLYTVNALFGTVLLTSDNMSEYAPETAALYQEIRAMQDAEDIRIEYEPTIFEDALQIWYTLDGVTKGITIP